MKKKKLFDLTPVDQTGCNYKMLIGMRSRGKSYEVKHKALRRAWKEGAKIAYIRRFDSDLKQAFVTSYWDDMREASNGYKAVEDITGKEWEGVEAYQQFLYWSRTGEDGKKERSPEEIGRYFALNISGRYKSQSFVNYKIIIVEELLTDEIYLDDEPTRLLNLISTICRDNDDDVEIYMIGNKLSRIAPYFSEWNLHAVPFQKPGTVDIYNLERMDGSTIRFAVYQTDSMPTKSKLFFGQAQKQIQGNEWDVKEVPHLEKPLEYYEKLYTCYVRYTSFTFKVLLLADPETGGTLTYIYPCPKAKPKKTSRIITDKFSTNIFVSPTFKRTIRPEEIIIDCFNNGRVCFSDNLTGADFNNLRASYEIGV